MAAPRRKPDAAHEARTGDCAAYVRVSTLDQGDRYSPASQLRCLRELAAREGNRIREDWVFTDKHSGKLESRPDFDRMKALVRSGGAKPVKVYIFNVDRFARKTMDALWLAADFKRHGVALGFYEMPYEDTPAGRLTFTQMCAVAEYVGEKIVEDSARGRMQMLEMGKLPHGSAPYGYLNEAGKLVIDPGMSSAAGITRRQVVEMIFGWRRIGWKTGRIIRELDARGILSPGHRGKGGVLVPPGLWVRQVLLRQSHEAYLQFQRNCLRQMANDDYELYLARANGETHVVMIGTNQSRAFCGADTSDPSRRTRAWWSDAQSYCCPRCREAVEEAIEELKRDARAVPINEVSR